MGVSTVVNDGSWWLMMVNIWFVYGSYMVHIWFIWISSSSWGYPDLIAGWFSSGKNGGFLKQGYPQIIYFTGIFPYKPTILDTPICGNLQMDDSGNLQIPAARNWSNIGFAWILWLFLLVFHAFLFPLSHPTHSQTEGFPFKNTVVIWRRSPSNQHEDAGIWLLLNQILQQVDLRSISSSQVSAPFFGWQLVGFGHLSPKHVILYLPKGTKVNQWGKEPHTDSANVNQLPWRWLKSTFWWLTPSYTSPKNMWVSSRPGCLMVNSRSFPSFGGTPFLLLSYNSFGNSNPHLLWAHIKWR